ncbi:hypothetical protein BaRGS_00010750 [Batillaria attramentaria]|uniref:Uncharacterized protein n=1 Tax=Batillaria attramentaria TaxID=370345 RepID=A0ABD0LE93_9CAEN
MKPCRAIFIVFDQTSSQPRLPNFIKDNTHSGNSNHFHGATASDKPCSMSAPPGYRKKISFLFNDCPGVNGRRVTCTHLASAVVPATGKKSLRMGINSFARNRFRCDVKGNPSNRSLRLGGWITVRVVVVMNQAVKIAL